MDDAPIMEKAKRSKTARRYEKLAVHLESGVNSVVGIKEAVYDHTYLLWVFGGLLLGVTLIQFHEPWQGDMWAFPDHEWALRHEWVDMVDEILGSCDEEGYMLGHFYNDSDRPVRVDSEHASHALQIQHVLESRWETTLLTWALHLNLLPFFTILARYYFFNFRQSLQTIFFLMWIFMFSGVGQFVALALRVGVASFSLTLWSFLGVCLAFLCLCIEVLAFVEMYKVRIITMFMNKQYTKLPSEHQEMIASELADERNRKIRAEQKRKNKKYDFKFVDTIVHILTSARDGIPGTSQRYKEKMS